MFQKICIFFFKQIQKKLGVFISYITRPISISKSKLFSDPLKMQPKTAIVMQGPLVYEHDFTYETLQFYKNNFPQAVLILSTWDTEKPEVIKRIKKSGVHVVINTAPEKPAGLYTINLQIVSSLAGIKEAQALKVDFILKTRTDQRIYGTNLIEFFTNLLKKFPVVPGYKQKQRIIVHSMYTFKYRLYSITDMNLFGSLYDMLKYYSVPLDRRETNDKKKYVTLTNIFEIAKYRMGEMYLLTEYMQKIGRKLRWTLKDSWEIYRDHFIVVDQQVFDMYWHKYDVLQEYRHQNYKNVSNKNELSFKDWFNLYAGFENKIIPEKTQDHGFDDPILLTYFKK